MALTREEALEKWCPFARVSVTAKVPSRPDLLGQGGQAMFPTAHNRMLSIEQGAFSLDACYCIADGCMAWQFEGEGAQAGFCGLCLSSSAE